MAHSVDEIEEEMLINYKHIRKHDILLKRNQIKEVQTWKINQLLDTMWQKINKCFYTVVILARMQKFVSYYCNGMYAANIC